ncbi:protein O-linked-mannose beta-1,2-N-acetylglucosaminyltransferase 1 isoform X3 [Exaiptasia diaphana]|uniref:Alpha-1,3-mannosyl-glycoprotein 2-beta-N-acetylglucosaminyltransferase n=1 Tax=Exaiptasia diaphana TaxID=2652724 RepID=A0A913Y1H7_EXADI|nr:protein O-linked-mannose beta-1,2-N-acetylglucosaminyltransferase 1 isoform X3 [Exaiptasia diaphana]
MCIILEMAVQHFQTLLFLAVFTTFLANLLLILKHNDSCIKDTSGFPWKSKVNMEFLKRNPNQMNKIQEDQTTPFAPMDHDTATTLNDKYEPKILKIEVFSSEENISVRVNGKKLLHGNHPTLIGINAVVVNQETGERMGTRSFDTYSIEKEGQHLQEFVKEVTVGRIICFTVRDEASHHLKKSVRAFLKHFGSVFINRLKWRDMWAFVIQKTKHNARVLGEAYQQCMHNGHACVYGEQGWTAPVSLVVTFQAERSQDVCHWKDTPSNRRRRKFCRRYEGYPGLCSCANPRNIDLSSPAFEDGTRFQLLIAIMASNRPTYLFRMITSLQNVIGLDASTATVYIDGFFNEAKAVAELFGLNVIQHEATSRLGGRIAQHYKKSLSSSFDNHPEAQHLVIIEEDLDVSVDILSYFKQLLPVLEKDESLFCISAWNDQGYEHVVNDPTMLYRIETMPGLGWVVSRKIYKGELEKKWPGPDVIFDWDMWLRAVENIKNRECIIPDISRTYHFGAKGMNVASAMQESYFKSHALNIVPNVKLDTSMMYKENYEKEIKRLIR